MKKNTYAHAQLLRRVLATIAKAGITSMHELASVFTLYRMFMTALTPWLEDTLRESACAALLQAAGLSTQEAAERVMDYLRSRELRASSESCRLDLLLRQATHGPDAAMSLLYHTVYHICLNLARTKRLAG